MILGVEHTWKTGKFVRLPAHSLGRALNLTSLSFVRYVIEDLGSVQVEVSPINVKNGGDVEVTYAQKRNRRLKMPLTWFGVFDGHGGDKASQYCVDWLSSYVRNDGSFPYDLGFSMKKAFTTIDDDFIGTGFPDGTTACAVSLVGGRRIVCANAGDSRAIVVRKDGSVVRLSRDHKPGMPDETRRITDLGGKVIYWGRWRVEGLLAVSRAIGDASLKPYVTSEPEVCEYDIGKDDWFLVLSSDGVWDVLDNEEAAHVVIATSCVMENGSLVIDTNRFKWAARNLCEHARYVVQPILVWIVHSVPHQLLVASVGLAARLTTSQPSLLTYKVVATQNHSLVATNRAPRRAACKRGLFGRMLIQYCLFSSRF